MGGGIICNFTPILPYFQHWGGINLDLDFFQVSKSSEDRKKKSSPKIKHFFSPNSGGNQRSDAHRSQIFGGVAQMKTILKLLGGCRQIIGGYISPSPRVSVSLLSKKLVLFPFFRESKTNLVQIGLFFFVHFLSSGGTILPNFWKARLDFSLYCNISLLHWSFSLAINCFEKSPKCHFIAEVPQLNIKTVQSCCYKTVKKRRKIQFALHASELVEKPRSLTVASKRSGHWIQGLTYSAVHNSGATLQKHSFFGFPV